MRTTHDTDTLCLLEKSLRLIVLSAMDSQPPLAASSEGFRGLGGSFIRIIV